MPKSYLTRSRKDAEKSKGNGKEMVFGLGQTLQSF